LETPPCSLPRRDEDRLRHSRLALLTGIADRMPNARARRSRPATLPALSLADHDRLAG
jgi:hypothetical protein